MKNLSIIIFVLAIAAFSYGQDYRIVGKEFAWATSKPNKMEFSFSYPEMKNFKDNITAMNLFNEHISNLVHATSDTFKVWMKGWENSADDMGSYYEVGDSVYYKSNKLVSIQFFEHNYFSGAAHPNNSSFTVNYDLDKNKEVTLSDLLTNGWVNKISDVCINALREQKNVPPGTEDDWIKGGAGPDEKNFSVFNVIQNGLVITFVTYQVGSYAEGPSEVFIPYADIKEYINTAGLLSTVK